MSRNMRGSVFSPHHLPSKNQTQITRSGSKYFYPVNHPVHPISPLKKKIFKNVADCGLERKAIAQVLILPLHQGNNRGPTEHDNDELERE